MKRKRRPFDFNRQRRKDIARLVVHRHGKLANAALCLHYVKAVAWHCPRDGNRRGAMLHWCFLTCAPPSVERQVDAILEATPPRRIKADPLARHLQVSDAERTDLKIFTIGAYDVPKAERERRRKERHRLRQQARRRANGAKPRDQSFSRTKPWIKDGIGERQWRRRRRAMSEIRAHDSCLNTWHETRTSDTACGTSRGTSEEELTQCPSDASATGMRA
jgi:hypothetical protein